MKITAMEEYGLRCALTVARGTSGGEPISAQQIAEEEGLSLSYAQKILRALSQGGLVRARRGVSGGYELAVPLEELSVGQVLRALGGSITVEDVCERHTGELQVCRHRGAGCTIRPVWRHITAFVMQTLDGIPLRLLLQDEAQVWSHLLIHGQAAAPDLRDWVRQEHREGEEAAGEQREKSRRERER